MSMTQTQDNKVNDISEHAATEISEDEEDFSDDEDGFIMMTPVAKMSCEIASQPVTTQAPFTHSMQKMLGDRLRNIPKTCQFRSPFQI
jgi:hypothetical protein